MKKAIEMLQHLINTKWYGKITFTFKDGKIVFAKKEETINLQG